MLFYKFAYAIVRFVFFFVFRLKFEGRENIPLEGGAIVAYNHRSNFDPVIAGLSSPRRLRFMAKEELFQNPIFGGLIKKLGAFPVHRASGDVGAIKASLKILGNGHIMLMFPEGHRIKDGRKVKAKPGVALIASRAKVPVIPAAISGEYKWMHKITVTYGEPITFEEFYGKKPDPDAMQAEADLVLNKIYELKAE